jgi:hypothetical protein
MPMLKPFTNFCLTRERGDVPAQERGKFVLPAAVGWADYSPCGLYRYTLGRDYPQVEGKLPHERPCIFILLNCSTATAEEDDITTHKCFWLGYTWGYSSVIVGNAFAFRATDPEKMKKCAEPVGPMNDPVLRELGRVGDRMLIGWGCDGRHLDRDVHVLKKLRTEWWVAGGQPRPMYGIALNHRGRLDRDRVTPRHPCYMSAHGLEAARVLRFNSSHEIVGIEGE